VEPIIVKIDPDIEDLIPGFLANRKADVDKIRASIDTGNYADIRIIGHSMKGAGGGYGFDAITEIGDVIERAALASDDSVIKEQTSILEDYLSRLELIPDPELS
jgi:hypothetical protein